MTAPQRLDELVAIRGRFARSVRLDKETGQADQLAGYLPTGRSLEVVRRLVQAMLREDGTRAFSITGPYGSGKSSLALFIDALLGHEEDDAHKAAVELLREYESDVLADLFEARRSLGAGPSGFIRAVVTAPQREPITTTVLRALKRGAARSRVAKSVRQTIERALERAESDRYAAPSFREIRDILEQLTSAGSKKPVLLIVDEFGKNLEAYAESGREGDLYLLQELAEWASGEDSLPLVLMTIQHLAFEAYAADATAAQRREWAKVQGRFEDIPFVDSAAATRTLIATALDHSSDETYAWLRAEAARREADRAEDFGLPAVADADTVASCYPLHPSTLLVLPELCARYGQNERTLFSFLASQEPKSVPTFAASADLTGGLPWVRLDRVYDYFVESASTFVGASREAARWIEVETTIRDAHGLTEAQHRVLKTVGVLNLVAAGGALRASRELLTFALADGQPGTASPAEVLARLEELETSGLVVYRDFATEYRVWRGSDFDLAGALRNARRLVRQQSLASLLQDIQPMRPLVAARHTIENGTTRAFARVYADRHSTLPDLDRRHRREDKATFEQLLGTDGLLVYVVDADGQLPSLTSPSNDLPLVTVAPADPKPVIEAAVEVAALLEVAGDPNLSADDRAAQRELLERTAYARQVLDRTLAETFAGEAMWVWHNPLNKDGSHPKVRTPRALEAGTSTAALSDVFDRAFADSPPIYYETINRTELTSQGAKARRLLLEAILDPSKPYIERLGLEGEGPDVASYRAIIEDSGMHSAESGLGPPATAAWTPVWRALAKWLKAASDAPVSVEHLLDQLQCPPYGLKAGTASVLLTLALVHHASEIALYEHGTFRPRLDAPLSERMVRNPANFAVKYLATGSGSKRHDAVVSLGLALHDVLGDQPAAVAAASNPTVLTVTVALVDVLHRNTDDFTRKSKRFHRLWDPDADTEVIEHACAVRDALLQTHEPDVLLFEQLPTAVGLGPLTASGRGNAAMDESELVEFARRVANAIATVDQAHGSLQNHVSDVIRNAADCNTLAEVVSKAGDLSNLEVLAPPVRRFADAARMFEAYTDLGAWLGAVTESVCGGSFRHWTDHTLPGHIDRLWQAASDFARVADLTKFAEGRTDGSFRAFQIQATTQRGQSQRDVVAVAEGLMSQVSATLDHAVEQLAPHLGGETDAHEALLAVLIERFVEGREVSSSSPTTVGSDVERQEATPS